MSPTEKSSFSIYHFHKKKFCITIVLDFSWDNCNTKEKLETRVMQFFLFLFFLGGGGVNKVHYGLCESSEFLGVLIPVILYIIIMYI